MLPTRTALGVAAILAALSYVCGCSAPPSAELKRFPIGIYNVDDPRMLKELRDEVFDTFCATPRKEGLGAMAKEAARLGMRMVLSPRGLLAEPLSQTKGWPVAAWYLEDEPDVNHVSPEQLSTMSLQTRKWDPSRLQTFVIGQGSAAKIYGHLADILMLDWYPVPHLPLESVADQIDLAIKYLPKGKPLWMVIQAFNWKDDPPPDPKKPRTIGRFPDLYEIRFMSYLAILHDASGLFYFRLQKPGGKTLLDYPEEWQAVTSVTREIASLKPILERGRRTTLPFLPSPDGVQARAWRYHLRDYVVILNSQPDLKLKVPAEILGGDWRPLYERRRDPKELLDKVGASWFLPPYRVLVLESRLRLFGS